MSLFTHSGGYGSESISSSICCSTSQATEFFTRSRCPACLLQACSEGLFGSGKGTDHTCLELSQAVMTWNGNKISVLVELPACKAHWTISR